MVEGYVEDGDGKFGAKEVVSRFEDIRGRVRYHG